MNLLLRQFLQIALFKEGPQSLPASKFLRNLALLVHLGVGFTLALASLPLLKALFAALIGTTVMVAFIHLMLISRGLQSRFNQTVSALAGVESFIGLAALPITFLFHREAPPGELLAIISMLIFAWNISIASHIFRNAFNLIGAQGFLFAMGYIMISLIVSSGVG